MLLRPFAPLVAPAISYGCEVWGSQLQGRLNTQISDAKKLQGVQLAFLRSVCGRLPVGVPSAAVLASEMAEDFEMLSQLV